VAEAARATHSSWKPSHSRRWLPERIPQGSGVSGVLTRTHGDRQGAVQPRVKDCGAKRPDPD
jgi:hypothetical protein